MAGAFLKGRWRGAAIHMTPRVKNHLRWALIHAALMFFFADLLAAVWPAFDLVWKGIAHLGVAVAAFLATAAEYLHDEQRVEK
jgi:hypothetical protein